MSKELVEQLRTHNDDRLYFEADVLMSEAADLIEQQQKRINELEAELETERCLSFRNQVSELKEQIRHLQTALADTEALEIGTGERLAAAQNAERCAKAQLVKLREVMEKLTGNHFDTYDEVAEIAFAALAQPTNDSALLQALTDPENQPNQYGVEFGMSGDKMTFSIGNQRFTLDYEPEEDGEFEFMRNMLINAFSTFTHDVKTDDSALRETLAMNKAQPQNESGSGMQGAEFGRAIEGRK